MFKNIAGKLPFLFHIDNDNIVDRAIHGNYDDKMIFPDVGGGDPSQHLAESPPSLFSFSNSAGKVTKLHFRSLSPEHCFFFSVSEDKLCLFVYLYLDFCNHISILYLANCLYSGGGFWLRGVEKGGKFIQIIFSGFMYCGEKNGADIKYYLHE